MNGDKKAAVMICMFLFLCIGVILGVSVTQLAPETKGFFGIQEQSSQLQVLTVQNQIQNPMKLKTTIRISNPTVTSISFNATVSYYGSGNELLSYVISDTLNGGQQKNYVNTNTVNVTAWDNTGIDITATG